MAGLSREDAIDLLKPPVDEVDANALRKERKKLTGPAGPVGYGLRQRSGRVHQGGGDRDSNTPG